jgi:hypothetical protein
MAHADFRIFLSQGKLEADRLQEKYILTELNREEEFSFNFK